MEVHVDTKLPCIKVEEEEDVSPPVTTSASFGTTSTTRTPSVARRRVSTCNDDVHALLNLDPASVAIRASMMGTNTLTLVANFAANLTHYVNLVQEGKKQDQHPGRPSVVISPSSNHCRPANSNNNNNNNQNNNNMDLDVYAEGFSDYVNQCVDQGPPTRTATPIMNHEAATHPNPNGNDPADLTNHNSNNATQESTTMAAGTAATGTTGTTRRLCQDEATQTDIPNKRPRISTDHPSVDTASEPPASVEDSTRADDTSEISNMAENKDNHFSDSSTEGTPLVAATTEPNNMTEHSNDDSTDRSVENTAPTNTETITNMTDQQPVTVSTPPGTEETSTNTTPANTETTNTTDQQSGAASEPPETEENCTNITPANTDTTNMTHQQSDTASTPPDEEETSTNTDSTSETTNMAEHKDIHFSDSSTEGPPLAAATTEPNTMMEHSDVDSTDSSVENTAANAETTNMTDQQPDTASTPSDTTENADSALESTNVVENNNNDDSLDCTMALAAPTTTISSFTAAEEDHHYINNKENHQPETTSSTISSSSTLVIHDTDGPDDYNGKLEQSQVPRSVGLTRTILNQHLESLGLTTQFGMAVLSKNGSRVSHITLNQKWNQCPYSSQHLLKWWLGKGKQRLRTASILDPAKSDNANKEVPIFFATPPKLGGAPCHYVGHYQCVSFEANLDVKFKGEERQALLQFQFVRFDEAMAGKLANIAANRLSKKE